MIFGKALTFHQWWECLPPVLFLHRSPPFSEQLPQESIFHPQCLSTCAQWCRIKDLRLQQKKRGKIEKVFKTIKMQIQRVDGVSGFKFYQVRNTPIPVVAVIPTIFPPEVSKLLIFFNRVVLPVPIWKTQHISIHVFKKGCIFFWKQSKPWQSEKKNKSFYHHFLHSFNSFPYEKHIFYRGFNSITLPSKYLVSSRNFNNLMQTALWYQICNEQIYLLAP